MGRPLRWWISDVTYFVTIRCFQSRMLLRPDPELVGRFGYWLARALGYRPTARCYGVIGLSNHVHALLDDPEQGLSELARYWFGNLARGVNALRGRRGAVFERRHSAEPVLDAEARVQKLVYLIVNPVQAGLVARHDQWPGLLLWSRSGQVERHRVEWFDELAYRRARRRARCRAVAAQVRREDFVRKRELEIHPLRNEHGEVVDPEYILALVRAAERRIAAERAEHGRGCFGARRVLSQHWSASPLATKRTRRPLCHFSTEERFHEYLDRYRSFCESYGVASERHRRGLAASFPAGSFPPWSPLVRVAALDTG